jgi:hypothetical protein
MAATVALQARWTDAGSWLLVGADATQGSAPIEAHRLWFHPHLATRCGVFSYFLCEGLR